MSPRHPSRTPYIHPGFPLAVRIRNEKMRLKYLNQLRLKIEVMTRLKLKFEIGKRENLTVFIEMG